jgi:glycerophosphoryl diester phosphodiesterase
MLYKSKYVTPVYRGRGLGRRRRRQRKTILILIALVIVLYLAFVIYSRKDDLKKAEIKPIASPASFTAVQMENGKFLFTWSSVKGSDGYKLYKYTGNQYQEIKQFGKSSNTYISGKIKGNYALKAFKKSNDTVVYSKDFTACKVTAISDMIEIVGHRGAMDQAPENTLASYKRASQIGYKGFETDYFETYSNDLIISHDNDISLFTDTTESVLNLTEATRMNYHITKGVNINNYSTQYFPSFEQAVQAASDYNMNIYLHTKNGDLSETAMTKIESIIKKHNMRDKATVFTPDHDLFLKLKEHDFRVGFLVLPNSSYDIRDAVEFAGRNKADILIMRYTQYLKKKHIRKAHKYNLKVGCYDRSDLKSAFKMVDFKVDFMITNRDFIS